MQRDKFWSLLDDAFVRQLGTQNSVVSMTPVSGGDTHLSYQVESSAGDFYFVKLAYDEKASLLQSEARSLRELERLQQAHYPRLVAIHSVENYTVLVLPWMQLGSLGTNGFKRAAEILVEQHQITATEFGWPEDNSIGAMPQRNEWYPNYQQFMLKCRFEPQLSWLAAKGIDVDGVFVEVEKALASIDKERVEPSLLHGDLWAGNIALDQTSGLPILYDPAPYYGDVAMEFGLLKMFGGFPPEFLDTYFEILPQPEDFELRVALGELYHTINHANIFGGSYCTNIDHLVQRISRLGLVG